jgi:hypothetical protein
MKDFESFDLGLELEQGFGSLPPVALVERVHSCQLNYSFKRFAFGTSKLINKAVCWAEQVA